MKNPLDTMFGRLVITTVGLLMLVHLTSLLLIERTRASLAAFHISRVVEVAAGMDGRGGDGERSGADILGISFVDLKQLPAADARRFRDDTNGPIERQLRHVLPPGTHVAMDDDGTLHVLPAGSTRGIVLPQAEVPLSRFTGALALTLMFAIVVAVVLAWQLNRPIRDLAAAAREHRTGHQLNMVRKRGPRELRELIGDFNDMTGELAVAERERAVMLASIAHDLRTPITRMQVRADLLTDRGDREGFLRDTESMSRVITQFLDFAREIPEGSPRISVDTHCRRDYTDAPSPSGEAHRDALVTLDLHAGPDFMLPAVDIDRMLSNLVENALTYGEPPVEITTRAHGEHYELVVRDHGPGVSEPDLDRVLRPFVRLDPARGGTSHSGLGLAIVHRLVRHHGGTLQIANAADGGLVIAMRFPKRGVAQ
ncbi:HAMP domain-containing protein [Burkholderia cenocepacia]|uniref:ATP-binding protein n=1 Tax=Burkholderia TaxID=32008 RepID=UPI00078E01DD|nr:MULTISPECIES: ATP-binding protein [Burkholderia]AMU10730.1 two-component sensor histidine kinase [Burkholderia cenocepacia]AMU18609.1 two-component sensor histidine kinase [Burkholderia cenocepacia]MBJ9695020.1 HAMP domain-containing protein [Burkholderia cenocepacia]MBN3532541.1 HAMP domain-containing protein [Burkholderia cenocepacia]MBO1858996.1 HAMP domain-containing protein [Burkholderia cenocepacia]